MTSVPANPAAPTAFELMKQVLTKSGYAYTVREAGARKYLVLGDSSFAQDAPLSYLLNAEGVVFYAFENDRLSPR